MDEPLPCGREFFLSFSLKFIIEAVTERRHCFSVAQSLSSPSINFLIAQSLSSPSINFLTVSREII